MRNCFVILLAPLALAVSGCGSSIEVGVDRLVSCEASIRTARELGAQNEPRAALHLKLAQDQLEQAKALVTDGKMERADTVLLRADADAELALALVREAGSKKEAQQAAEKAKALKGGK
jgi:hypothetical protein